MESKDFEIIDNYLKLTKMTPVGTFDIRSEKAFRYTSKLKKILSKERVLSDRTNSILSVIILNNARQKIDINFSVEEVTSNRISCFIDFDEASEVS